MNNKGYVYRIVTLYNRKDLIHMRFEYENLEADYNYYLPKSASHRVPGFYDPDLDKPDSDYNEDIDFKERMNKNGKEIQSP